MRMTRVSSQEDSVVFVEMVDKTLTNRVGRPPRCLCNIHRIWRKDLFCGLVQVFKVHTFGYRACRELNVEPNK
jgi:hypothetical protein